MKHTITALLLAALAIPAAMADSPAEIRTQSFKKILRAFEPMGMVVRDRDPYNKAKFIAMADSLKQIAAEPFNHFPANSIDGKSRAKPEIWSQPAKFQAARDTFLKVSQRPGQHRPQWRPGQHQEELRRGGTKLQSLS
jgi:cytochrome c556